LPSGLEGGAAVKPGTRLADAAAVRPALLLFLLALLALGLPGAVAEAAPSRKKAIWGPVEVEGRSQFPRYAELGVGIYQASLRWDEVAPTAPKRADQPGDPAYRWPAELDAAVREARRYGIEVSLMLSGAPRWANGGRPAKWAPRPGAFGAFARAAARRYPGVRLWLVWGEPTKAANFQPLPAGSPVGPRRYARLLDAAYAALKAVRRQNLVIGGNTYTSGVIRPRQFIRWLRLPDGRPPRMDLYGHNPFGAREPDLRKPPLGGGYADFSDLDTLMRWLDRNLGRPAGRPLRLFLSEYGAPTDHANRDFNFWVTRAMQARWAASSLRIARATPRIFTLGWVSLYDQAPDGQGTEVNTGLLDWRGNPKPAYAAFRDG
jgi:hypothetical protein